VSCMKLGFDKLTQCTASGLTVTVDMNVSTRSTFCVEVPIMSGINGVVIEKRRGDLNLDDLEAYVEYPDGRRFELRLQVSGDRLVLGSPELLPETIPAGSKIVVTVSKKRKIFGPKSFIGRLVIELGFPGEVCDVIKAVANILNAAKSETYKELLPSICARFLGEMLSKHIGAVTLERLLSDPTKFTEVLSEDALKALLDAKRMCEEIAYK